MGEAIESGNLPIVPPVDALGGKTMNGEVLLMGRDQIPDSLKTLVYRHLRKRRWDERQLAEQRTTKHQLEARKSCVIDARSYRVAREFPMSAAAQLDWKTLVPDRRPLFGSDWLKKFRDEQLKHWLTAKQAS
jgi:hypothetical protein